MSSITELEDYAVNKRVAPSVELEAAIERLLAEGLGDVERLAEVGRLGARLAIQRAVEEEVEAFLGRTRYERTPKARGWRNGNRPRQVQTAESELEIQVPQIRGAAARFVSKVIPNGRTALPTRPLEALIIGGWVRGLSESGHREPDAQGRAGLEEHGERDRPGAASATRRSELVAWARSSCS